MTEGTEAEQCTTATDAESAQTPKSTETTGAPTTCKPKLTRKKKTYRSGSGHCHRARTTGCKSHH